MNRWLLVTAALVSASAAVLVMLTMAGAFAFTYDPVQPRGSIDNAPVRAFGFILLGMPPTFLIAFLVYFITFRLHPPTGVFSRAHFVWALAIAILACIPLAVSARESFAHWYEALYLAPLVPLLFLAVEVGFLAGSAVAASHNRRLGPTHHQPPSAARGSSAPR